MIHQANTNSSRAEILKKIKMEFYKFHTTGQRKYLPELRALACSAVDAGIGQRTVAKAGGVSLSAVNKWVRISRKNKFKVKRLNLVPDSTESLSVNSKPETEPSMMRIRLVSGVEIELPKTAFNAELLAMLSLIDGRR